MNKKLVIIAGQTGVGKTAVANEIARKINGEIVLVDSIQLFKNINIIANKPSKFLQEVVKYHNINEYNLSEGTVCAFQHAENIRKIINDIWARNKVPVLEGGCGLYYKALLTGASRRMTPPEEIEYAKNIQIANEIIKRDNNFNTSFARLKRLDNSLPDNLPIKNDLYRLGRRLADALTFGSCAYKLILEKDKKIRSENQFDLDTSIYNFFLYCDRQTLSNKLKERTQNMLTNGLLDEVAELLNNDLITPEMFYNKKSSSTFVNAYGLIETLEYLNKIIPVISEKNDFVDSFKNPISYKDKLANSCKTQAIRMIQELLNSIFVNNRQYAKRQATWFKKNENFLWLDGNKNINELSNLIINNYLEKSKTEFTSILESKENAQTKDKYKLSVASTRNENFDILKNRKVLETVLEKSFNISERNTEKIDKICKANSSEIEEEKFIEFDDALIQKHMQV